MIGVFVEFDSHQHYSELFDYIYLTGSPEILAKGAKLLSSP